MVPVFVFGGRNERLDFPQVKYSLKRDHYLTQKLLNILLISQNKKRQTSKKGAIAIMEDYKFLLIELRRKQFWLFLVLTMLYRLIILQAQMKSKPTKFTF